MFFKKIKENKFLIILVVMLLLGINFINNTVNTFEYLGILLILFLIYEKKNIKLRSKKLFNYKIKERILLGLIFTVITLFYSINQTRYDYLSIFMVFIILQYYMNIGIPLSGYKMMLSWLDKIIITILVFITSYILLSHIGLSLGVTLMLFIFVIGSTTDREKDK